MLKYTKTREVKDLSIGTSGSAGIDFYIPRNITEKQYRTYDLDAVFSYSDEEFPTLTGEALFGSSRNVVLIENGFVKSIHVPPAGRVFIPSGIICRLPPGYMLLLENKSGVSTKKALIRGACVVDEDYTGEIHINLYNVGECSTIIHADDKIIQGILIPVLHTQLMAVESKEILFSDFSTDRGAGGFGSTGV